MRVARCALRSVFVAYALTIIYDICRVGCCVGACVCGWLFACKAVCLQRLFAVLRCAVRCAMIARVGGRQVVIRKFQNCIVAKLIFQKLNVCVVVD